MTNFIFDFLANDYYVWGTCITLFIIAEKLFPHVGTQKLLRKESGENLFFLGLNEVLNRSWLRIAFMALLLRLFNFGPWLKNHSSFMNTFSGWPFWLQFLFIFLLVDFLAYALHYFVHRTRLFWRFHILHHSSERIDWLAGFKSHWIDSTFIDLLSQSVPLAILPVSDRMILVFGFMSLFFPFFTHANIRIGTAKGRPPKRQVFGWICSPMFHHWHHDAENHFPYGQNFGLYTLIWDRLFGTLHMPAGAWPHRYGLMSQEKYVRGVVRRFCGPFLPGYNITGHDPGRVI